MLDKQKKEKSLALTPIFKQLESLESILNDSLEYIIISVDLKGKILGCNKIGELAYGYKASELARIKISDFFHPLQAKKGSLETYLDIARHKGRWKGEIKCLTKGNVQQLYTTTIILRTNINAIPTGFTIFAKSLLKSEQIFQLQLSEEILKVKNKKLNAINTKMLEISRLKNEFLANMSHDLRTPLNGIIGFAEIMYDGKVGPVSKDHKEYLGEILSNAHMLLLLINDTLDLAKIESGKMEFRPEEINLLSLVNEVRSIFDKIITDKNINLQIKIAKTFQIYLDPNKLKQVIYNLVSNAFKFSHKGGRVTISAKKDGTNKFTLAVRDEGIGIRQKDFKKLFVEFQQLEPSTTKRYQGTGLGLALARRIAEAQGGKVWAESIFGKGSVFFATLPCHASLEKYGVTKSKEKIKRKDIPTILIIEEKSRERDEIIDLLTIKGYIVKTADNIDEAIEKNKVANVDAIILDFFTSDISKWKLLREFRCKQPFQKAPSILIGGVINKVESIGFKIHDFLVKPVTPKELVNALKWSGANPNSHKVVLIIDDKKALKPHAGILKKFGYQAIYQSNVSKALQIAEEKKPDVVILNPFIESKGMTGFEFLHSLRLTVRGLYTPIVITTLKILNQQDREHLKGIIQRVVLKKGGVAKSLLDEITRQYPIRKSIK